MSSRWQNGYFWLTLTLVFVSLFLVYKSSTIQSLTIDESNHYFCGLEWWQNGTYTAWPENPPLARAIIAIGPYLDGHRADTFQSSATTSMDFFVDSYNFDYFNQVHLKEKLLWIRISVMVLFLLSILVIWRWSFRLGGHRVSVLAVGMYATLPTILGHSGIGTTDIIFVTCFIVLLWRFFAWVKDPTMVNGVWFGVGLAAGMLAKYSVLPYFFVSMLVVFPLFFLVPLKKEKQLILKWFKQALPSGLLASVIMFFVIWGFYRFSIGAVGSEPIIRIGIAEGTFSSIWQDVVLPFPEWFAGLLVLLNHNKEGHLAYLLGSISETGFWYFYPLSFLVKTPLPFLLFTTAGIFGGLRYWKETSNWELLAFLLIPIGIVATVLPSHINLGLRHVLLVYPILAMGASLGLIKLADHFRTRYQWAGFFPVVFVGWQLTITLIAFPFYLSYFNWFAGEEPGKILVDSDLDWGQGLFELVEFSKENKIDSLNIAVFTASSSCLYDFPSLKMLPPDTRVHGWVAVSEYFYQGAMRPVMFPIDESCSFMVFNFEESGKVHAGYKWLDKYPVTKIGGGAIRMYFIE